MKKLVVIVSAIVLGVSSLMANVNPSASATLLPEDFKQEIVKHIDYPEAARKANVEGEVWMKVTLDENSKVRIVDLSATAPELGDHVKTQLADVAIENTGLFAGNVYLMKVKFDLTDK